MPLHRLTAATFFVILCIFVGGETHGEVFYSRGASMAVPAGEVVAVEMRGTGNLSLRWPGAEFGLSLTEMADELAKPSAIVTFNGRRFKAEGIDCHAPNTLSVEWLSDSLARILVGHRELRPLGSLSIPYPSDSVYARADELTDLLIETNPNSFARLITGYSPGQLAQAGQWTYLDRETSGRLAVLGGQYTLAQIENELIYLSGAMTNSPAWQPGMLKGRLLPTGFDNYFHLQWIDATGRELPGENFARLDPDLGVLTLTFPSLKTTVRLKRVFND